MTEHRTERGWWSETFDPVLGDLLLERRDGAPLRRTISFLREQLVLEAGDRVFDQCCGTGSISEGLAREGIECVGVDQCEAYIERARDRTRGVATPCTFHVGDAHSYVPAEPCDAALNWYTSFGYSPDDATNARMLGNAFRALRPGGRFALDFTNVANVLRDNRLLMKSERQTEDGRLFAFRTSVPDLARGVFEQQWTTVSASGRVSRHEGVIRMYMPWELDRLLREVGFVDVRIYGDTDEQPLSFNSPRCICIGRRPEA